MCSSDLKHGWFGIIVPPEYGGTGGSAIDLAIMLEEIGSFCKELVGAEGATAPEPLRQTDRRLMALWKAAGPSVGSPKG